MLKPLTKTDYRQLFCAALRSGKYEQIKGEGWCGNKVCALGVGVRENLFEDNSHMNWLHVREQGLTYDFYEDAARKLALDDHQIAKIYEMNDDEKVPFEDIAAWIEKQP